MKQASIGCVLLLAGCGSSGGGLSSLANDYAASYCHFIYHCCTPSDRANSQNPFAVTFSSEESLGFATEDGCASRLGAQAEIAFQAYQDSVAAKRMSYNDADGQACLSAMAAAAKVCDPNAFLATSTTKGACDPTAFFTGLAPGGGDCTMDGDCAVASSICEPVDGGIGRGGGASEVVSGAATCVSPHAIGTMCNGNDCAAGSCCSFMGPTCLAYVAEGAMCDVGCDSVPCDPAADYCDLMGEGVCHPLIATGGTCNPQYYGGDCVSSNCVPNANDTSGICSAETEVLQICVGNPNGF